MLLIVSSWSFLIGSIQKSRLVIIGLFWCLLLSSNCILNLDNNIVMFNNLIVWKAGGCIIEILIYIIAMIYLRINFSIEKVISLFSAVLIIYSNDLMCMYIILEIQSLIFYILVAKSSISSALKYFIIGSFASTLILLGIVINMNDVIVIGILIKLGIPPFHQWNVDILDCSELDITAWFSTIGKLSLIYVLINFIKPTYILLVGVISCFIIGTFMGFIQLKIKRLIAYSGIIHLGFMLLGKGDSNLIYMVAYSISLIIFLIIIEDIDAILITDINLNWYTYGILIVNILSLAGFPPFIGFLGKLSVIESIVDIEFWVGFIAMIVSIFSFFIYFNLLRNIKIDSNLSLNSWSNSWIVSYGTIASLILMWTII